MTTNFLLVPSGSNVTEFSCKSGNNYVPVNNIITNVAQIDVADMLALGVRQVAGPDAGASLPWVAGRFYAGVPGATPGTLLLVASTLYAYPFRVPANIALQTLSANVTTLQAGSNVRFGLYSDLAGSPNALVAGTDSGTQASTATGALTFTPSAPITLNEGWYWAAVQGNTSGTMATVSALAASYASNLTAMLGQDTVAHAIAASAEAAMGVSGAATFGAMPATFPTPSLVLNAAVPMLVIGT
jgi:hypothetical protein